MTKPLPRQLPGENTIILNYRDLLDLGLPFTPNTALRLEKHGLFPRRIRLSASKVGWLKDEVLQWIEALKDKRATDHYEDPHKY